MRQSWRSTAAPMQPGSRTASMPGSMPSRRSTRQRQSLVSASARSSKRRACRRRCAGAPRNSGSSADCAHTRSRCDNRQPDLRADPAAPAGEARTAGDRAGHPRHIAERKARRWPVLAEPGAPARPRCRSKALGGALPRLDSAGGARSASRDPAARARRAACRRARPGAETSRRHCAPRRHVEPGEDPVVAQSVAAEIAPARPEPAAPGTARAAAPRAAPRSPVNAGIGGVGAAASGTRTGSCRCAPCGTGAHDGSRTTRRSRSNTAGRRLSVEIADGESRMDALAKIKSEMLPFAELMGIEFTHAAPDRVVAEMTVRDDLCTRPAVLHGGAIMALADTLGGVGTFLNLPEGAGTTTIESKTNFIAAAPVGTRVTAEATPLHRGRRTMVWQTRITTAEGRLVALVTQTQPVLWTT